MAKLSPELKTLLDHLQDRLLEIVNEAKALEFTLLQRFGETPATTRSLDELAEIAEQGGDFYSRITALILRVAESQPIISSDMERLLSSRIATLQARIPALERSIEEVKLEWRL